MATSEKKDTATIKSVHNALEVLEAFSECNEGIKLSRLSEQLNMNKSGLYRLLQVFKQRGYLEQDRSHGEYRLGLGAYMVGQKLVSNMELLRTVRPVMEELVRENKEAVYLAVRCDHKTLLFDNVDSRHPVNVMSLKGRSYPLAECAAGEILLAFGSQENKPTDICKQRLEPDQLVALKEQGYSRDVNRLGDGIASLAVPLLNESKSAVGCLCLVGPEFRFTDKTIHGDLLAPLIDAGQAISARLGYFGYHLALEG